MGSQIWRVSVTAAILVFGFQLKMINKDQDTVINSPISPNRILKFKVQKGIYKSTHLNISKFM